LGNPHSAHDAGATTRSLIDEARDATLTHLNAPIGEYAVVFTSGATGAVRLLAEGFPFKKLKIPEKSRKDALLHV